MTVWIGTAGWQYADWQGRLYPRGLPRHRWLEAYASGFATVESNNAFYRLPGRHVFESWRERTPDDFVMAVKVSRYLTHIRRLREPREAVARFVDRTGGLGDKLGPVLLQLPPQLQRDDDRLAVALAAFPETYRVAVEFRHDTWFASDVRALLEERRAALCLADRKGPLTPIWRTADWTYLRFHEGRANPRPCYGRAALDGWARRLAATWSRESDAFVYFNNDPLGCAPRDAVRFAGALRRAGLEPSRVPRPADVPAG